MLPTKKVKTAAAIRWLQERPNWFLLVDNVDTPEAVTEAERLLGNLANGHVVYTSRIATGPGMCNRWNLTCWTGPYLCTFHPGPHRRP